MYSYPCVCVCVSHPLFALQKLAHMTEFIAVSVCPLADTHADLLSVHAIVSP